MFRSCSVAPQPVPTGFLGFTLFSLGYYALVTIDRRAEMVRPERIIITNRFRRLEGLVLWDYAPPFVWNVKADTHQRIRVPV